MFLNYIPLNNAESVLAVRQMNAPPCAARMSALEMTLRRYSEKKIDTVIVPVVGSNFNLHVSDQCPISV